MRCFDHPLPHATLLVGQRVRRAAAKGEQGMPRRGLAGAFAEGVWWDIGPQAPVTRQITSPTSSAISSEPSGPSVTPTGRP